MVGRRPAWLALRWARAGEPLGVDVARVRPDEYQVHKYRIARTSIDGHNAPRRLMFEATVIEETDGKAILRVADEALLVVSTLDELLRTLGLEREDLIDA